MDDDLQKYGEIAKMQRDMEEKFEDGNCDPAENKFLRRPRLADLWLFLVRKTWHKPSQSYSKHSVIIEVSIKVSTASDIKFS